MDQDSNGMISRYQRDGYYFPIDAISHEQAVACRAEIESVWPARKSDPLVRAAFSGHANFVLPAVDEITRLPGVLNPVTALLGPDLLVWGASLFIKEPQTPDYVSWHQDLTYWDLDDVAEVTAWVALSPATIESGCMRFVPGSHTRAIVQHRDTFVEANMLSRGQEIAVDVNESQAVDVVLQPGQMSLHHGHMFHASRGNRSEDRRIGLAIRYITPAMRQKSGVRSCAHLVAGEDRYRHFELQQSPVGVMTDDDLELVRRSVALQEQFFYDGAAEQGKRLP